MFDKATVIMAEPDDGRCGKQFDTIIVLFGLLYNMIVKGDIISLYIGRLAQ